MSFSVVIANANLFHWKKEKKEWKNFMPRIHQKLWKRCANIKLDVFVTQAFHKPRKRERNNKKTWLFNIIMFWVERDKCTDYMLLKKKLLQSTGSSLGNNRERKKKSRDFKIAVMTSTWKEFVLLYYFFLSKLASNETKTVQKWILVVKHDQHTCTGIFHTYLSWKII